MVGESEDWLCKIAHGLFVPLARTTFPEGRARNTVRVAKAGSAAARGGRRGQGARAGRGIGRRTCMSDLRLADGEKRFLLSLHGMWQHEWMLIRKPGVLAWRKCGWTHKMR